MAEVKYTRDHEWVRVEGDVAVVGITDHAQEQLGDVVFVELPKIGKQVATGDEAAVVESVKAAAEIYAPIDGEVVAINGTLEGEPGLVNSAPEGDGWFIKITLADRSQLDALMDRAAYDKFVADQA